MLGVARDIAKRHDRQFAGGVLPTLDMYEAIERLQKPVIASVNGYCVAGGMELMLSTDIRVAAEHATFGLMEWKWGLIPHADHSSAHRAKYPIAMRWSCCLPAI